MSQLFMSLLTALITVGGVGVINYIIAEQLSGLDTSQQGSNREKAISLVFSMFDLLLFLVIQECLKPWLTGNVLLIATMVCTIVISTLITLLFSKKINELFYKLINLVRKGNHQSLRRSETNWQSTFETHGHNNQRVFLYDFNHNTLGFGWRYGISNDKESNYSVSYIPDIYDEKQPSYDDLMLTIQTEEFQDEYDVLQYTNFKQNFIAVVATLKDEN